MTNKILVIGSINMDLVVKVERMPKAGDTVLGTDVENFAGGKGANQAVAAAKAGGSVSMMAKLGNDAYGKELLLDLEDVGIDTGLVETEIGSSGIAFITIDAKGENMIVVSSGANRKITIQDLGKINFSEYKFLVLQLEIPINVVKKSLEIAKANNLKTILNVAPAQILDEEIIKNTDFLILNEGEAALLANKDVFDKETAIAAAKSLIVDGAKSVIVTLGADGLIWQSPESSGSLDAHKVNVVDTTAAGDCFCGALAVALSENKSLKQALEFANAAAALATTKKGAQPSLPSRAEIEKFLAK
ncbi:MAG TPA: ribokinase [Trueperaceae bacterium]|nr:ribokinase [Trueperaceae bacterium]